MGEYGVVLDGGKLNLAALERSIAEAVIGIEGVCATGPALLRRAGIVGWPRVDAWLDGTGQVHVKLRIAARIGHDLALLSAHVQDEITRRAAGLTGRDIAPVDVYVRRVVV